MMKSIAVLLAVLMMFTVSISVVAEVNERTLRILACLNSSREAKRLHFTQHREAGYRAFPKHLAAVSFAGDLQGTM